MWEIILHMIAWACIWFAADMKRSGNSKIETFSTDFWIQALLFFIASQIFQIKF